MPPKTKMSYAVGDVVVAEVDDIVGTVDDPVIALKIRDGDNEARAASMNTRDLSPMERLAFQTGSVVQVKIANMEKETIQVTLARQAIQKQENWQSKSKGKGKSRGDDAVASGEDGSRSRQESKRPRGAYKIKAKAAPQPPPPANLLLNNLKAGAEIEGVVTSLSNYAAFVQTNIMRKSKGGGYSPVTAMLHDSDLAGRVKLASQVKEYSEKPVLEVGAEVTAFVKEVYKNAG
jgi:ribosomal protein S1